MYFKRCDLISIQLSKSIDSINNNNNNNTKKNHQFDIG